MRLQRQPPGLRNGLRALAGHQVVFQAAQQQHTVHRCGCRRAVPRGRHQLAQGIAGRHRPLPAHRSPLRHHVSGGGWCAAAGDLPHHLLGGLGRSPPPRQPQQRRDVVQLQAVPERAERPQAGVDEHAARHLVRRHACPFGGHHRPQRHGQQVVGGCHGAPRQLCAASLHHALYRPRRRHMVELAVARQVQRQHIVARHRLRKALGKRAPVRGLARQPAQQDPLAG